MELDMHFHSTNSDGRNTIDEIVLKAKELGLQYAFLTDHDKLSYDFLQKSDSVGLKSVLSTEISSYNPENDFSLHLTYYTNNLKTKVESILKNTVYNKILLVKMQIEHLHNLGFDIDLRDFYRFCNQTNRDLSSLNKYDVSCYLMTKTKNRKIFKSLLKMSNFDAELVYLNFFKKGGQFFGDYGILIPEYEPEIKDLGTIRKEDNGILIMAHPNVTFKNDTQKFLDNLDYYLESGVNGIEINAKATQNWVNLILDISKQNDLFVSFGSDNHGIGKTDNKHGDFGEINYLLDKKIVQQKFDEFAKYLKI